MAPSVDLLFSFLASLPSVGGPTRDSFSKLEGNDPFQTYFFSLSFTTFRRVVYSVLEIWFLVLRFSITWFWYNVQSLKHSKFNLIPFFEVLFSIQSLF